MNIGIIILAIIAGIWGLSIFLGAIGGVAKNFTNTPAIDSSSTKSQEEQIIQDTEQKQKIMMDDIRQRIQDTQQHRH